MRRIWGKQERRGETTLSFWSGKIASASSLLFFSSRAFLTLKRNTFFHGFFKLKIKRKNVLICWSPELLELGWSQLWLQPEVTIYPKLYPKTRLKTNPIKTYWNESKNHFFFWILSPFFVVLFFLRVKKDQTCASNYLVPRLPAFYLRFPPNSMALLPRFSDWALKALFQIKTSFLRNPGKFKQEDRCL